jgi:hypothetical protein
MISIHGNMHILSPSWLLSEIQFFITLKRYQSKLWGELTETLTVNKIKIVDDPNMNAQVILSTHQVYDYIISGDAYGSPILRYLEEAELELKCLAFQDFNFTNPEGANYCEENGFDVGS